MQALAQELATNKLVGVVDLGTLIGMAASLIVLVMPTGHEVGGGSGGDGQPMQSLHYVFMIMGTDPS